MVRWYRYGHALYSTPKQLARICSEEPAVASPELPINLQALHYLGRHIETSSRLTIQHGPGPHIPVSLSKLDASLAHAASTIPCCCQMLEPTSSLIVAQTWSLSVMESVGIFQQGPCLVACARRMFPPTASFAQAELGRHPPCSHNVEKQVPH